MPSSPTTAEPAASITANVAAAGSSGGTLGGGLNRFDRDTETFTHYRYDPVDPHGISSAQGDSNNHTNLINFDSSIVSENSSGSLEFVDTGTFTGRCSLTCHGRDHSDELY